jgi:DNA-binding NtrC family response regulator
MRVLLAEDEVTIAVTLRDELEAAGHVVLPASDTRGAIEILEREAPDVVLTDMRMPGAGGMAVLERSMALDPRRPVVVITGYASIDQAVEAMRLGAANYVQKPFRNEALVNMVGTFARMRALEAENTSLRLQLAANQGFEGIIGASDKMLSVFERVRTVAPTEATVLIQGESGTGKERIARAIHHHSARASGPFIALSCAALPESLLEAELFGFEKGAFTDAKKERRGRFELADGGTFFLDDIDDMPPPVQVKLLRVLQERNFERLGGEATRSIDIRVVAATKVSLRDLVRAGKFREDLFYRINVVPVQLPPLRERKGDIPLLLVHLIERHGHGQRYTLPRSGAAILERYPWPGNVRELENAVQRAIALSGPKTELAVEDLLPLDSRWRGAAAVPAEVRPLRDVMREAEVAHIRRALEQTGGHRSQTADVLGISRKVLWEKMRDFGIEAPALPGAPGAPGAPGPSGPSGPSAAQGKADSATDAEP